MFTWYDLIMAFVDPDTVTEIDNAFKIDCQTCDLLEHCKDVMSDSHNFKILAFNIRSIRKNFTKFLVAFKRLKIEVDVIILSECWLGSNPIIGQIPGYDSYATTNNHNRAGGVVAYTKTGLNAVVNEFSIKDCESLKIEIPNIATVLGIYRSPSFTNINTFCNSLSKAIEKLSNDVSIIIAGDLNINIESPLDKLGSEYLCLMTEYGLLPAINKPTRLKTCLDHIFVKSNSQIMQGLIAKTDVTDHCITIFGVTLSTLVHKQQVNRHITMTDFKAVANTLHNTDWSCIMNEQNVNQAVDLFHNLISSAVQKHTQEKRVSRSQFNLKPWITPGLMRCMKHRDKLHLDLKKHPNDETKSLIYRRYRNFCNDLLHNLKTQHENAELEVNKNNPKKLWKTIQTIIDKPSKKNSATGLLSSKSSPQEAANHCNEYLASIGSKLANDLLSKVNKSEADLAAEIKVNPAKNHNSFFMQPTDEFEVGKLIDTLKKDSASGIDNIKPSLVKAIKPQILMPLTYIINLSLSTGIFPDQWKLARVTPIHKNGPKTLPENYRPISLLGTFSKILEKIVNHRLVTFLEKENLICDKQFGFRRGKSTEDAVNLLSRKIATSLDKSQKTIGVFLDLAKAFDTVSGAILLKKLEYSGIRGLPLEWFRSYLTGRSQCVKINDVQSDTLPVLFGVPQGSVLGPTFFILYMNDIHTCCSPDTDLICYADDTVALFHAKSWKTARDKAESGMALIKNWLDSNLLTLNLSKTKYLCFHKTKASEPLSRLEMRIHSCDFQSSCNCSLITRARSIKYLGIEIDENLSFKEHITNLAKRVRKLIYVMGALRASASEQVLRLVYGALCESILSYCIVVWGGAGVTAMIEVERAQRAVLKVMYKLPYRYPTIDLYSELGMLNVRQLYILKVTLAEHRQTSIPKAPSSPRRRLPRVLQPQVKTAFAHRLPEFSFPYIYNKINDKCNIRGKPIRECKRLVTQYLRALSYDNTESFLKTTK